MKLKIIMRILLPSLLAVGHFLCVSLPVTATSPDSGSVGKGSQESYGVAEGAKDEGKAGIWESFSSPSDIFESVQNAYLPSTVRMAEVVAQAFSVPEPSSSDFWEKAKEYEQTLQEYIPRLLRSAGDYFKSAAFTDVISAMNQIVNATATFRDSIQGALDAQNVTLDKFTEELEVAFTGIFHELENIPPPDKASGHDEREEWVDKILEAIKLALSKLGARFGIKEDVTEAYLAALIPHLRALMVAVGYINEQYPQLFPMLAFSIVGLLLPQYWILRPLLSLFGFGPLGPIKGSIAAWLQSYFWGAAVSPGSWFAFLQAAGMGNIPMWAGLLVKAPFAIAGGWLAKFFNRG